MPKKEKQIKRPTKIMEDNRIIDLLECIGVVFLYLNTNLTQKDIAHKLRMDINRVNLILKDLEKPSKA